MIEWEKEEAILIILVEGYYIPMHLFGFIFIYCYVPGLFYRPKHDVKIDDLWRLSMS